VIWTTRERRSLLLALTDWLERHYPHAGMWGRLRSDAHFYVECARAAVAGNRDADISFRRSMDLGLVSCLVIRWYYLAMDPAL
jgi:hypothetical protein